MSSIARAIIIARKVNDISGKKTYIYRCKHTSNIDVWHGGKKHRFNTNQAAQTYLNKLYRCYIHNGA